MIEAFVYPVSAVMKLWHWLFASVLNVSNSPAWVASVVLLVVTVRALIAPLSWMSYKTGRLVVIMRPKLAAIQEQYGSDLTPEGVRKHELATREVHKEHRYNPFAGCFPALLQVPFFLGLYRLLLWMAVPERAGGHATGVLSPEEVASFQQASLFGVPLPSYMSMAPEQFAHLGTTLDDVRSLAIPMLLSAVFFTTFNMILAQLRTRSTLEWDNRTARVIYMLVWIMVPFIPLSIGMVGLTGKVPIALLLYWFTGNLWTLGQTIVLWWLLVRVHPLDEEVRAHIAASRDNRLEQRRELVDKKRSRRRRQFEALTRPSTIIEVRRELAAEKAAEKRARAAEKTEKKDRARQRSQAKKEAARRDKELAAQRKPARDGGDDQME